MYFFFGDNQPIQLRIFFKISLFLKPYLVDYKSIYIYITITYDKTNYIFGMHSTRAIYPSTRNYLISV
jgi:hypothetical protein